MRPALLAAILFVATAASAGTTEFPVEPPSTETVVYEDLWRTDPYSDEYLMGNVRDGVVDDDGNFYFLDTQLQEVTKFDADGNFVATIARKGEGPGELDRTWRMAFWPPDELVLPRVFPPKVVRIDRDGTPLEALRIYRNEGDDTQASIFSLTPVGEKAIVRGSMFTFDDSGGRSTQWMGLIDREGTVLLEYDSKEEALPADPLKQVFDEAAEFWSWARWAVMPDGTLFRAPDREKWLVEKLDLEANLLATWTRDVSPRERTDEETEEMMGSRSFFFNGQEADVEYKLLDTEPPIGGLRAIGDELWVQHNPADGELPEGVYARFSVFSVDGEFKGDRDLEVPHDPDLDFVRIMPDGRVVVIENGVEANEAAMAAFGGGDDAEEEEDLSDAEPAEIVVYAPKR